ncbi:MAG: hypothetical protein RLZZ500_1007 [Bacteroidota bacterium]
MVGAITPNRSTTLHKVGHKVAQHFFNEPQSGKEFEKFAKFLRGGRRCAFGKIQV